MDYISLLSLEEQRIVCILMGGSNFKELFVNNPTPAQKLIKGFRINKLTEEQVLDIAVKNANKSGLVRDGLNIWIEYVLQEISQNIQTAEQNGHSHEESVSLALADSYFINNIDIYFKLVNEKIDKDTIEYINQEIAKTLENRADISAANEKIAELENRIKELEVALEKSSIDCGIISKDKEKEKADYEAIISSLKVQISELSDALQHAEAKKDLNLDIINDQQQLAVFADKLPDGLPDSFSNDTASLCKVSIDYTGNIWLMRIADIDHRGSLIEFCADETRPFLFDNRNKLFHRDGPSENGSYAVWSWNAIPNISDHERDYVTTKFANNIIPIEVVKLTECENLECLISVLKNGYHFTLHSKRVMFAISNEKGLYEGILCSSKDIEMKNGTLFLSSNVVQLPVYEFKLNNAIITNDGVIFLDKICVGIPSRLYRVKKPFDIVKSIVLDTISWSSYKNKGIAKAEYRCFKELISALSSDDIIRRIATACNCNIKIASELLDQFISEIHSYIETDTLEDIVIESALNTNEKLMQRAKDLIMESWRAENSDLLRNAEFELCKVVQKKKSLSDELSQLQSTYAKLKEESDAFSTLLAEKEKLANDVEEAIEKKIKNAQLKAADFIANMAFVNSSVAGTSEKTETVPTFSISEVELHFKKEDADKNHNWAQVIDTLNFELGEAGISSKYSKGLATFLLASFIAKEPLFIIGPNSDAIVEAFAISVFGCNLSVLNCDGIYSKSILDSCDYYRKSVVMIKNIIHSKWIEHLPELVNCDEPNPYCFAIHPYTEDIQIESKSIYNYILPLFTEFFVDKKAKRAYCGGYLADDFTMYTLPEPERNKKVSKLSANNYIKSKLNQIITIMHSINNELSDDDEFIYGVLQYAYATLDSITIKNMLSDDSSLSTQLKNDLKDILGDTE